MIGIDSVCRGRAQAGQSDELTKHLIAEQPSLRCQTDTFSVRHEQTASDKLSDRIESGSDKLPAKLALNV